jgi:hypothetical protein
MSLVVYLMMWFPLQVISIAAEYSGGDVAERLVMSFVDRIAPKDITAQQIGPDTRIFIDEVLTQLGADISRLQ